MQGCIKVEEYWWPTWDQKIAANYTYLHRQLPTLDFAINHCRDFRTCLQAGGHVGVWANHLARYFERVITVEAEISLYECLLLNMRPDIEPVYAALNCNDQDVKIKRSTSSGSNRVCAEGQGVSVRSLTIDSFGIQDLDLLVLDIEGHELPALNGAVETIRRCQPIIQLEEPEDGSPCAGFLEHLGYKRQPIKQGKDRVYLPWL